jgi:hypothetical protein
MGIFSSIMQKIFHHPKAAPAAPAAAPQAAAPEQPAPVQAAPDDASAQPEEMSQVDVEAVLTSMADDKGGGGNWRTSIVDLLKLLDLDSSLDARKELADELDCHEGPDGSAEENIALHHAVMAKLAQNGGMVPDSLRQ